MTCKEWYDAKHRLVREWHCCGQVWQLIISAHFPGRTHWHPQCRRCVDTPGPLLPTKE